MNTEDLQGIVKDIFDALGYWENRCKQAENIINEINNNPDIDSKLKAYELWKKHITEYAKS